MMPVHEHMLRIELVDIRHHSRTIFAACLDGSSLSHGSINIVHTSWFSQHELAASR